MRRLALALLGLAAIGLSACGGGEGRAGDEEEIKAVIAASATSTDPADCLRYGTMNALEQSAKLQGEAAVRACEEAKLEEWPLPTAVNVTRIDVDGDSATAQVAFVGGLFGEQVPVIALVEEKGSWKEDELLEFAEFDRDAFVLEFGRALLLRAGSRAERDLFGCMIRKLDERIQEQLEALLIDPSPQPIIDLTLACEPRSASA